MATDQPLKKQDLLELEKRLEKRFATKEDLEGLEQRFEKRFVTRRHFDHAIGILEQKIDRQLEQITEAIASALEHVPTRPEFDSLASRVTRLERKVG